MGIPIVNLRRSSDRFWFIMGILKHVRRCVWADINSAHSNNQCRNSEIRAVHFVLQIYSVHYWNHVQDTRIFVFAIICSEEEEIPKIYG